MCLMLLAVVLSLTSLVPASVVGGGEVMEIRVKNKWENGWRFFNGYLNLDLVEKN